MDFFGQQSHRRRQSHWLLLAFAIAMGLAALFIHASIALLYYSLHPVPGSGESLRATIVVAMVWAAMILGGVFRYLDFRAGGASLASRFGAVPASDRDRQGKEKRLLQVVAEMAIAAGHPAPDVYVLHRQTSINAFVLGQARRGYALVVTEGALNTLDRDELQAVVAHEFAHLVHGDVVLNMRLMIVLGALLALDEIGHRMRGWSSGDSQVNLFIGAVVVGSVVRLLGLPGLMAGRLLQAAISRKREFLADATAVQFTRYPEAMASALDTIDRSDDLVPLQSDYAGELLHLCFHEGDQLRWYERLLATHPTLDQRIEAVFPGYDRRRRRVVPPDRSDWRSQPQVASAELTAAGALAWVSPERSGVGGSGSVARRPAPASATDTPPASLSMVPADAVYARQKEGVGADSFVTPASSAHAVDADAAQCLSDRVMLMLNGQGDVLAALFAALADVQPDRRRAFVDGVGFAHGPEFKARVEYLSGVLEAEIKQQPLELIGGLCERLQAETSHDSRQRVMCTLEQLTQVSGDFSIMQYATLQVIRRQLGVEFPVLESVAEQGGALAHRRRVKSFEAMGEEFALLLSLMIESSGAPDEQQEALFARTLRCYTQAAIPRRTGAESGLREDLENAFQTLYAQPRLVREAFVRHCQEIALVDGQLQSAESALLALFSASLDCTAKAA